MIRKAGPLNPSNLHGMIFRMSRFASHLLLLLPLALGAGCSKQAPAVATPAAPAKHEHHPPHGGTPVVLGDEVYHLEIVRVASEGKLQAYILDGEMEAFIRSAAPAFQVDAMVDGQPQVLRFEAVANPATGETVGDTSLFEARADWVKTNKTFDGILKTLTIRGTTFTDVEFNFPLGNDKD